VQRPPATDVDRMRLALERVVGDDRVLHGEERLLPYTRDWSGADPVWPDLAVEARTTTEVERILELAHRHRFPVTPRGMGSGKSGGALAVHGGLVLGMASMDQIQDVDGADLVAVVQAGTPLEAIHRAVEAEGLFYPPDPGSGHLCSIGGNVACNAGGPRALKYGVTKHYVLGLEMVTPSAGSLRVGSRSVKHATGFDMAGLMVGSEGLLGVISSVTLRLLPRPVDVRTALFAFDDPVQAGNAVTQAFRRGVHPRCLEFLDRFATSVMATEAPDLIPEGAGALLIVETDGTPQAAQEDMERLSEVFVGAGAIEGGQASGPGQRERIWAPRRWLSESLRKTASRKRSEDVTVPRSRIPELLARLRTVAEETQVRVAAYGHAGDGNLHVNVLFEPDQAAAAESALRRVAEISVGLGGTISGEHGVGWLKRDLLPIEQSASLIALQEQLKGCFDPHRILNPGKVFPSGRKGWE
jgi:glycolate oxidase